MGRISRVPLTGIVATLRGAAGGGDTPRTPVETLAEAIFEDIQIVRLPMARGGHIT